MKLAFLRLSLIKFSDDLSVNITFGVIKFNRCLVWRVDKDGSKFAGLAPRKYVPTKVTAMSMVLGEQKAIVSCDVTPRF